MPKIARPAFPPARRQAEALGRRLRDARLRRRTMASALTLLGRGDGEAASYLELAQIIQDQGAAGAIKADLAQLFRRAAFNVMAGNRDDHLRNHALLRTRSGWRLAPAFDMNPDPARQEHAPAFAHAV